MVKIKNVQRNSYWYPVGISWTKKSPDPEKIGAVSVARRQRVLKYPFSVSQRPIRSKLVVAGLSSDGLVCSWSLGNFKNCF